MLRNTIRRLHNTISHTFLVAVIALGAVSGCRSNPATPPATASVSENTWATVDGRSITRDDVERAYRRLRDTSQPLSEEEVLAAKLSILNDLILQDILIARAQERKIEVAAKELDAAYAEAKQNIPDATFQQELTKRGLTPDDMREGLRRELLTQKVIEQEVTPKVNVTSQEVSEFFLANRSQFNLAEDAYRIAQIVVTPVREPQPTNSSGDDAATPEAAATKVRMLMEKLKGGASFGDLARQYSEDPESGPRGGDLGLVPLSRLKQAPPQLRDAVIGKKPGMANVVSAGGAHTIVLVLAHEPAGQRDLSTPGMNDQITNTLRERKEQLLRGAFLTSVREDAQVTNYLARRVVESQGKLPGAATTPAK